MEQGGRFVQLTFHGAAECVTGSCFLLDTGKMRILVDCGLFQGSKEIRQRNYGHFPFSPQTIDLVLLTHAHIDHSGLIPKLVKEGFSGPILGTGCTVDLCHVLLPDSGSIQETEVQRKNRKAQRAGKPLVEPIYTMDDAYACLNQFRPVRYNQDIILGDGVRCRFRDAGHILGSALVEVWVREPGGETKIVFSGDLGNKNKPFVRDPEYVEEADYIVLESTYGDRVHQEDYAGSRERLKEVVWSTYRKGGNLLIPAFAVERTQELLYDLFAFTRAGEMPPMQIWLDSPLATAVTNIFGDHPHCFDDEASGMIACGIDPLGLPQLNHALTVEESKMLNQSPGGNIIIAGSGMCDAGRIRHHLKHNLWRPEATVLLVGYQAEGTLGRLLLNGAEKVRLFGEEIVVRADVVSVNGYSAHADQKMLREWVGALRRPPRQVFLVHGEQRAQLALRQVLAEIGVAARIPAWQETVRLEPGRKDEERIWQLLSGLHGRTARYLKANPDPDAYRQVLERLSALDEFLAAGGGRRG
jgi:metallo-beta-lactamase family protein